MTRQPDWDIDRAKGEEAEQLVRAMRSAVLVGTCEVKRDDKAATHGNVYVEYACRNANGWALSGIATTKANQWAFVVGNGRIIVQMPVWLLKGVAREFGTKRECVAGSHPTRGVVIPLSELVPRAIEVLKRPIAA